MPASHFRRTLNRTLAMAGKEVQHIRRDIRTLYLALAMPVLMLVLFGFGISFDVDHLELAVVDQDRTEASRELVRHFTASQEFTTVQEGTSPEQAMRELRRGGAVAVLVVPAGFSQDVARGGAQVQLLVDGADGNTATQALAKAQALVQAASQRFAPPGMPLPAPPLEVRIRTLFNPTGRSALYLVPGLASYLLAIVAVLMTALTVAREWERGSMEQLFATPVGRLEIVVGKLLPYLAIGLLQVLLVITVGAWVFDVPVRGSLVVLALGSAAVPHRHAGPGAAHLRGDTQPDGGHADGDDDVHAPVHAAVGLHLPHREPAPAAAAAQHADPRALLREHAARGAAARQRLRRARGTQLGGALPLRGADAGGRHGALPAPVGLRGGPNSCTRSSCSTAPWW